MPFMFLVFLYFFSSALVLYWTVQNIMTILQTLLTKNTFDVPAVSNNQEESNGSGASKNIEDKKQLEHEELDEKQAKSRNLLGLKMKGKIDLSTLEDRYKDRMKNYTPERLSDMSEQKKLIAEEKRDKITDAYKYLKEGLLKKS